MRMLRDGLRALSIHVIAVALAAPAPAQDLGCARGQTPMAATELIFGRNIGRRLVVTEARWAKFVASEIAPRLSDGFTVLDGQGHYRAPGRRALLQEPSKIVLLVAPKTDTTRDHISAIVAAYKQRSSQRSVVVVSRPVCASF